MPLSYDPMLVLQILNQLLIFDIKTLQPYRHVFSTVKISWCGILVGQLVLEKDQVQEN